MALIDPPAFLGLSGNEYPAARLRRVHQVMLGGREGCLGTGDMVVAPTGTPGLSVQVAAGTAVVNGDDATRQGSYVVESDGATTVGPVSTPHSTLPRIDRLVLEVLDQEGTVSGGGGRGSDLPQYRIVAGTPASSPTPPAEPPTAITLALITVAAGASSILAGSIVDWRPPLNVRAGAVGEVAFMYAAAAPWGSLVANGGTFDAARYPALAAYLGATSLPDALGRVPMGAGAGAGLTPRTLGQKVGAEPLPAHQHDVNLETSQAPDHVHENLYPNGQSGSGYGQLDGFNNVSTGTLSTKPAGRHKHTVIGKTASAGSGSHGVVQPSIVFLAVIWT